MESKLGWVKGFAPLSGVILCIILLVMIICSMHWVRRGGYFQVSTIHVLFTINDLIS
jgi:hypothetical protein